MGNPAADSLLETVQKINEIARRARSGEPQVEDYLHAVSCEPRTEWFTTLLREKNEELLKEREQFDRLCSAVRAWYTDRSESEANLRLAKVLSAMGIVQP
jgi:hypothetical protein